jgi:hypothetical protein
MLLPWLDCYDLTMEAGTFHPALAGRKIVKEKTLNEIDIS